MLDLMRRQSYLVYLIFGGIIFIFALNFGPGSSGCAPAPSSTWAARINGETVRLRTFANAYGQQVQYLRGLAEKSGITFDDAMAERMGLRSQVLDQLVEGRLLAQTARQLHLQVGDADLLAFLRRQYGVADVSYAQYENWVTRTFDASVAKFEAETRDGVAASRLAGMVAHVLSVGDGDLKEAFVREHDRAKIRFARFDVEPAAEPEPAATAVDALLKDDMPAVTTAYAHDSQSYQTPQTAQVRQILRRLPAGADAAAVAAARALLLDLRKQLEAGADFAALAQQHSQDEASAAKGGDLGQIGRGHLVRPLEEAIFALPAGGVAAEPVQTPQGLHLVRVDAVQPAVQKPLEEVQRQVAAAVLRQQAAKTHAKSQAAALRSALAVGQSWEAVTQDEQTASLPAAMAAKPLRRDSGWIRQDVEALPRIGLAPELQAAIFAQPAHKPLLGKTYAVGDSFFVVAVQAREQPDLAQFEADRVTLRQQAAGEKQNQVLHDWLGFLRRRAKVEVNPGLLVAADPPS